MRSASLRLCPRDAVQQKERKRKERNRKKRKGSRCRSSSSSSSSKSSFVATDEEWRGGGEDFSSSRWILSLPVCFQFLHMDLSFEFRHPLYNYDQYKYDYIKLTLITFAFVSKIYAFPNRSLETHFCQEHRGLFQVQL